MLLQVPQSFHFLCSTFFKTSKTENYFDKKEVVYFFPNHMLFLQGWMYATSC